MGQGNWKWSAGAALISAHLDGPTSITALSESAVRRTPPRREDRGVRRKPVTRSSRKANITKD